MVFRYRTVETFLAYGTPLSICDIFRPLFERAGVSLSSSKNLGAFISRIEAAESTLLNRELSEQYLAIAFDGTFRLGEAINTTGRWRSHDFRIRLRLLDFATLAVHADQVSCSPSTCARMHIFALHIISPTSTHLTLACPWLRSGWLPT